LARQGAAKLLLQNMLDAAYHEIDDRLRRIDDAVRIGDLDRKPLKEFFVDGIQELLLLFPDRDRASLGFELRVVMFERRKEIARVELAPRKRLHHLLDLRADRVLLNKIGIGEDALENAAREQ